MNTVLAKSKSLRAPKCRFLKADLKEIQYSLPKSDLCAVDSIKK